MAFTTVDDPSKYFQVTTYTSNGSAASVTNAGNSDLQPDWIWATSTSHAVGYEVWDSTRGVNATIFSHASEAEDTSANRLVSFDSDGFSYGASGNAQQAGSFIAWQWKANGGSTSSNGDGSITSTVQANTTAGVSVVTWTGTGSAATIGHGLGKKPALIISKNRTSSANWSVRHHNTANNYDFLTLNTDDNATANDSVWTQTNPTASVFSIGTATQINQNTHNIVAYCLADIPGYQKIGKYTGNADVSGTFIYTGFKPNWVIIKRIGSADHWNSWDLARSPINPAQATMQLNRTTANNIDTAFKLDLLSNGFKIRTTFSGMNSAETYIYYAVAKHPLVTSKKAACPAQ